jgi:adenylate cyclase
VGRYATLAIIFVFAWAFFVAEGAREGTLDSRILQKQVAPALLGVSGTLTDFKFRLRGRETPKNKIVLVEIDDRSLTTLGRWPWPRDQFAFLLDQVFRYEPKAVGFDILFSEPEGRIPATLSDELERRKLGFLIPREADSDLVKTVKAHASRIVLAWSSETGCTPRFPDRDGCPVTDPEALRALPASFENFSASMVSIAPGARPAATAIWSFPSVNTNILELDSVARHSGFANAYPDLDGTVRVHPLISLVGGKPQPSMPLELARAGLKDQLSVAIDRASDLTKLALTRTRELRVNRRGLGEIRYRGPGGTFESVSAADLMKEKSVFDDQVNRKLANVDKGEVLRDAYVLIGATALGLHDFRTTPFDGSVSGLEIQATILDNVLAGDFMSQGSDPSGYWIVLALMTLGIFGVVAFAEQHEATAAIGIFGAFALLVGVVDLFVLFPLGHDWNTGFLYLETATLMMMTVAAKYVSEEQKKKFIRGAFAKYLAPAFVDQIVRDPTKLTLGGQRKALTILFSDIRGFTTFSEKMDAKLLSDFLNDYLGIMTRLVFENRGTLDKYIGDAVMAFWGAPLDNGDHALDSCATAIRMMRALDENRQRFKEKYGVDVHIGVGINTGEVSVGNMGSDLTFSYTVIGDSVNLASRLEGATKAYGVSILATHSTLESIRESHRQLPSYRVLDQVKVKGKKKAVEIVEIFHREIPDDAKYFFEKGRTLYAEQKWDDAILAFQEASRMVNEALGETDGPSTTYISRCEKFKKAPPASDWDGSWEFDSK